MKLNSLSVVCLSLLLFYTHYALARRGGGGFSRGFGTKTSTSNRGNANSNAGNKNNKGGHPSQGGHGFGGHGTGRGSPSDRSRGFGRSAVMAAAGGAMTGMALGYGLGRFPHPPFQFHNLEEEYYYNDYMHKKYGARSTDTRDYAYSKPPEIYDRYMDSCMKRDDLLSAENQKPNNESGATTTATATSAISALNAGSNTTETNSTAADNSSTTAPPTPNHPGANPVPPDSEAVTSDENNDTVSIVEIGYPALIEQKKARRCVELYMVYYEKYLKGLNDGVQRLQMGSRWLVAVVASTILMLLNSNMQMLLH